MILAAAYVLDLANDHDAAMHLTAAIRAHRKRAATNGLGVPPLLDQLEAAALSPSAAGTIALDLTDPVGISHLERALRVYLDDFARGEIPDSTRALHALAATGAAGLKREPLPAVRVSVSERLATLANEKSEPVQNVGEDRPMTTKQAAEWVGVKQPATIRGWINDGSLPAIRHGRAFRILKSDLEKRRGINAN